MWAVIVMDTLDKIKVTILLTLISITSYGQKYFNAAYDNNSNVEGFSALIQMADSGYVVAGTSKVFGIAYNYYVLRTDKNGSKLHEAYFEIPQVEIILSSIKKIDNGSLITCGLIMDQDSASNRYNRDVFLARTTNNGDTIWTKRFRKGIGTGVNPDFEAGKVVMVSHDGGFVIAGYTSYSVNLGSQIYVIKTDSLGNVLWEQTYGGANVDDVYELIETSDKGYLLAGYTYSYGNGDRDGYLIKIDSLGNFQWQKTYGGLGSDGTGAITKSLEGGYMLGGWTNSNTSQSLVLQPWFIKINDNGVVQWDKKFGGDKVRGDIEKLIQLPDSSYVGIGNIKDTLGMPNAGLIMKINISGDSIWAREYKRAVTQDDYFNGFNVTNDDGFIIAGQVSGQGSLSGTQDGWLVKVDCLGADSITHYFGDTCYTSLIGIKEINNSKNENVKIFPNPAQDFLNIEVQNQNVGLKIEIENILGQTVYEEKTNSPLFLVNIKCLESGIYSIKVYNNKGQFIETKKFVKE